MTAVLRLGRLSSDDDYESVLEVPLSVGWMPRLRRTRLVTLRLQDIRGARYWVALDSCTGDNEGPLERLGSLWPELSIRIYLLGSDTFSGARRLFVHDYDLGTSGRVASTG